MFTPDDYKAEHSTFKSAVLPIRGNPENINFIDEVMRKHGFASRGVALDYIITSYQKNEESYRIIKLMHDEHFGGLKTKCEKLEADNMLLQNDNSEKLKVIKTLTNRITDLEIEVDALLEDKFTNECGTPEGFKEFYEETVAAFRMLFSDERYPGHHIPDQIALMMDYCKRDPSNEFPFQPVAEAIYNKHKISTNGGEENNGAAAEQQPSGS